MPFTQLDEATEVSLKRFVPFSEDLCDAHFNWDFNPGDWRSFEGGISRQDHSGVTFTAVTVDPISGRRTERLIDPTVDDKIAVTIYNRGEALYKNGHEETRVTRSHIVIWDGMRPGGIEIPERASCISLLFPREMVSKHILNIDDLCWKRSDRTNGSGRVLSALIENVFYNADEIPDTEMPFVLSSVLDMIGFCFSPDGSPKPYTTENRRRFAKRIEICIRENLTSASLTADLVAAKLGITRRYLHHILAERGTTFSKTVRKERLVLAERMLTSSAYAGASITSIAFELGFCDGPYFTRVFKGVYGVTPRDFRRRRFC